MAPDLPVLGHLQGNSSRHVVSTSRPLLSQCLIIFKTTDLTKLCHLQDNLSCQAVSTWRQHILCQLKKNFTYCTVSFHNNCSDHVVKASRQLLWLFCVTSKTTSLALLCHFQDNFFGFFVSPPRQLLCFAVSPPRQLLWFCRATFKTMVLITTDLFVLSLGQQNKTRNLTDLTMLCHLQDNGSYYIVSAQLILLCCVTFKTTVLTMLCHLQDDCFYDVMLSLG